MKGFMKIGGLDPSLNNFGMAKGDLCLSSGSLSSLELLLSTTQAANKKTVRKNSDDLRRAKEHFQSFHSFFSDVDVICVEIPVGSQSARSMASYGVCVGLIASIGKPLIQVTPAEVKLAATQDKKASKEDMINWAVENYPQANWYTHQRKGVESFTAKNEHLADALAAIYAGVKTDDFKTMMAFFK